LYRTFLVLIVLRLLMPPGICVCKHSSFASRALTEALGGEHETAPEGPDDHDHVPGCPASDLAAGMGLFPAGPPSPSLDARHVDLSLSPAMLVSAPLVAAAAEPSFEGPAHLGDWPADSPRFLMLCALLI
jgi:hypothetical protein